MTYEEIQNYPVGTIYKSELITREIKGYWYNEGDRISLMLDETLSDIHFHGDCTYTATSTKKYEYKIDGWLFDGEEWHCVERTIYDEYEKIEEEELIKK